MLPLSSPIPMMQGSFLRGAPGRLSTSLYASVSRKISGVGVARCSDGYVSSQSINPPSPPQQSGTTQLPDSALPTLAPLPSASRSEKVRFERSDSSSSNNDRFRSVGSRSEPSLPSIPGKFSKYSKPISKLYTESGEKRAERRDKKAFRKPMGDIGSEPDWNVVSRDEFSSSASGAAAPTKGRRSPLPTDQFPEWMQQYRYSYSEEPTAPIIGFRQHPWSPFGPADMVARPWTGSAPLKPSKKKRPEFDSFNPPPLNKKGVKYVQRPGPFPPGEGPKPAKTREEILGAPLTPLEIHELVATVNKGSKQLNLGRDGLTHNMLDVIHSHWKRSVLCKIKCKGVPTIDMDNVARVIEERTGGVIIHRAGGVIYLFRGRNYNYKDRPKIPIMLWKPPDPIYPRLIQPIPEGLTYEEAKSLRAKGRRVAPLCKLSKNGVYLDLAADVRAQFEIDEVVRVDCEGMNPTDYKKIGAKLKELVPCTLLSFEKEQIIMCRKKAVQVENVQLVQDEDENPSDDLVDVNDATTTTGLPLTEQYLPIENEHESKMVLAEDGNSVTEGNPETGTSVVDKNDATSVMDGTFTGEPAVTVMKGSPQLKSSVMDGSLESEAAVLDRNTKHAGLVADVNTEDAGSLMDGSTEDNSCSFMKEISKNQTSVPDGNINLATSASDMNTGGPISVTNGVTEGSTMGGMGYVDVLWQKAIEEGKALQLDNKTADPDVVLKKAAELSDVLEVPYSEETGDSEQRAPNEMLENERNAEGNNNSAQVPPTSPFDVTERLRVDELAKLLAP